MEDLTLSLLETILNLQIIGAIVGGLFVHYLERRKQTQDLIKKQTIPYLTQIYTKVRNILYNKRGKFISKYYIQSKKSKTSSVLFLFSFGFTINLIKNAKKYEEMYLEMNKKGLIESINNRTLRGSIKDVYSSSNYVAKNSYDLVKEINEENEYKYRNDKKLLKNLIELSTHNLIHFSEQLETELRKYLGIKTPITDKLLGIDGSYF